MVLTTVEKKFAFGQRIMTTTIKNNGTFMDPAIFMEDAQAHFIETIENSIVKHKLMKVSAVLKSTFTKEGVNGGNETKTFYFRTSPGIIDETDDLKTYYDENVIETLKTKLTEFEKQGNYTIYLEKVEGRYS